IYHIVYELAAYDLNVFLTTMRYNLRKIRHATATPERTGSANMWPGDLISESVNLADALDYLHNRLISSKLHSSLSHNDIKPENILVVYPETTSENDLYPVGQWKLADFGLSKMKPKRLSGGHSRHLSAGNAPLVSSYPQKTHRTERPKSVSNAIPERYPGMYTAPELDQETPQKTDCRSADVWSFGCVLSEIVTYAVNLDFRHVETFRESLLQSIPADPKFYNKSSKEVKPEFHSHLASLPDSAPEITRIPRDNPWTTQCVDLIKRIVVKEPNNRLGPGKIRLELSQIGKSMYSGKEEW
ncbi:kinase-like domain-containing protein, partial [Alternaria rosae]|uniref:kinase-like domain-containing protein n=1 Tax=Alternaria rosae TaxID=1187941 RepID=UPI001E8DB7FA